MRKIEVSAKTIIFAYLFPLFLWFLYQARSIIVMLFISFILMTAINPLVKKAKKIKIPPFITIFFSYLILIGLLSASLASLVPAVIEQTKGLISQLPSLIENLENSLGIQMNQEFFTTQLSGLPSNALKVATGAVSNIVGIFAIFFMTYYLIIERERMHTYLVRFFDHKDSEEKTQKFVEDLEKRLGSWVRGQAFLMTFIGITTYIGYVLLGLPYTLPLAILAGLLELVPSIGPIIAAIPAVLVGFTVSPLTALGAIAFALLIQHLEGNLIVPQVMKRAVGIRPLLTITVLFTGFTLAGVVGAILSMPVFITIETIYNHAT